jgi:hypothetical protein
MAPSQPKADGPFCRISSTHPSAPPLGLRARPPPRAVFLPLIPNNGADGAAPSIACSPAVWRADGRVGRYSIETRTRSSGASLKSGAPVRSFPEGRAFFGRSTQEPRGRGPRGRLGSLTTSRPRGPQR